MCATVVILLEMAREFRQFESVFIFERNDRGFYPVRIFTMDVELDFVIIVKLQML
jgi:predicted PhzF superfamily epimerase YddE/YHI9